MKVSDHMLYNIRPYFNFFNFRELELISVTQNLKLPVFLSASVEEPPHIAVTIPHSALETLLQI